MGQEYFIYEDSNGNAVADFDYIDQDGILVESIDQYDNFHDAEADFIATDDNGDDWVYVDDNDQHLSIDEAQDYDNFFGRRARAKRVAKRKKKAELKKKYGKRGWRRKAKKDGLNVRAELMQAKNQGISNLKEEKAEHRLNKSIARKKAGVGIGNIANTVMQGLGMSQAGPGENPNMMGTAPIPPKKDNTKLIVFSSLGVLVLIVAVFAVIKLKK